MPKVELDVETSASPEAVRAALLGTAKQNYGVTNVLGQGMAGQVARPSRRNEHELEPPARL